jgi:hypothetical protein
LRAERGFLGEEPGIYPPEWAETWQHRLPNLAVQNVLGVNHYTILFNDIGVTAVAESVLAACGSE